MSRMLTFEQLYLDWFNNYLTVKQFAIDYGFSETRARRILTLGKRDHYKNHEDTNNETE